MDNQKTALAIAFNSAIGEVYKQSLRSWKKIVQSYVLENTDFLLNLMPEIEFLVKGTELLQKLKNRNLKLCRPEIYSDRRVFRAFELYNPAVALKVDDEIVLNDIEFDEKDTLIYVLTGPNRGGKSVITCAGMLRYLPSSGCLCPRKGPK